MTKKKKPLPELEVDFYSTEADDEILISIRTTNGAPVSREDRLDAYEEIERQLGEKDKPITAQDIAENPELN